MQDRLVSPTTAIVRGPPPVHSSPTTSRFDARRLLSCHRLSPSHRTDAADRRAPVPSDQIDGTLQVGGPVPRGVRHKADHAMTALGEVSGERAPGIWTGAARVTGRAKSKVGDNQHAGTEAQRLP